MDNVRAIIFGILFLIWLFAFIKIFCANKEKTQYKDSTKYLVRVAIFGAISALLYTVPFLKFPVFFFPSFLEFHFDEVPVFIAGFAYGPLSALGVLLIKTIIKLPFTSTLCVGELSDFIFSAAFVLPAAIIYKRKRNFKGALFGILIGGILQLVVSLIGNIYVMVPFYLFVFNMSSDQLLAICQLANPAIKDIGWTYGLIAVLPFNVIKNAAIIILTILVYKSTHTFIDKFQK